MSQAIARGVLAAALICGGAGAAARAPAPPPRHRPQLDRQRIQGTWQVVRVNAEGKHPWYEVTAGQVWVITGDRVTIRYQGGQVDQLAYKLDPFTSPRAIDLTPAPGTTTRASFLGIYELDGDRLTVNRARGARPKRLALGEFARGQAVLVLKRTKR